VLDVQLSKPGVEVVPGTVEPLTSFADTKATAIVLATRDVESGCRVAAAKA
jgi:hypothetical protein